jgi:hypothetical protein
VPADTPTVFRNVFTGATIETGREGTDRTIAAATLFAQLPIALLVAA